MHARRSLLACVIALSLGETATAARLNHDGVPEGFESLIDGQSEQVEIILLGQPLGLHAALVKPETLTFEAPPKVADALLAAGVTYDRDALVALLSAPLPRNSQLACEDKQQVSGCNYLATDTLGLIYDEHAGRASLFLARDWLPANGTRTALLHTPSTSQNALIHRQQINYSGTDRYSAWNLSGMGALGLSESTHVGIGWNAFRFASRGQRSTRLNVDNAYLRHDLGQRHYVQAGRMDGRNLASAEGGNFGLNLLPQDRMVGVRVGTTLAYLNREALGSGTPVTVILNQRARVDAFRGEELLSTSYLDPGVQEIDTRSFPEGSYPVTLRVIENGNLSRSETIPFSRVGGSAGEGGTQWFVQAGQQVRGDGWSERIERPHGRRMVQAGIQVPLARHLAVTDAISMRDHAVYNEARLDWDGATRLARWSLSTSRLDGSDGSSGAMHQLSITRGASLTFYHYSLKASRCEQSVYQSTPLAGCRVSTSLLASAPLWRGTFTAGLSRNKSSYTTPLPPWEEAWNPWSAPGPDQGTARGSSYRQWQLGFAKSFSHRGLLVSYRMGATRSSGGTRPDDTTIYLSVALSQAQRAKGHGASQYSNTLGLDAQGGTHQSGASAARLTGTHARSWNGAHTTGDMTAYASVDNDNAWNASITSNATGRFGTAGASIGRFSGVGAGSTNYSATYSSSLAIARAGAFVGADAGNTSPGAAVVVTVDQAAAEQQGRPAALVSGSMGRPLQLGFGQRTLIPVAGFMPSNTTVADATASTDTLGTVTRGSGMRHWFLTPGRLGVQHIESSITYTAIGQLVDSQGAPLVGRQLIQDPMVRTQQDGSFVASFHVLPTSIYAIAGQALHACPVEPFARDGALLRLGALRCERVEVGQLPPELRASKAVVNSYQDGTVNAAPSLTSRSLP